MAQHNQIPKGVSRPIDPGAPSLLTSLPPEVRNAIYDVLFTRDQVLVHNAKAYHATEPEYAEYAGREYFIDELNISNAIYEAEVGVDAEFCDGLGLSLPFLRTCRQIYHEGAGVLYGCNTFVITRALNRHDCNADHLHQNEGYSQLSYAPIWLSDLGSQAALLRNVLVDIGAMCPSNCDYLEECIDILPILRFLWFHAHKECSLAFAHLNRELSVHESVGTTSSSSTCVKAGAYNNMLHKLVVDDVLCLKRFARSERILSGILVFIKEGEGFIRHSFTTSMSYILEDIEILEGQIVRRKKALAVSNPFERLSWHNLRRIVELTVAMSSARSEIVFDLDSHRVRGLPMDIFHVNKNLRYQTQALVAPGQIKPVVLEASVGGIITNFNTFSALKDLIPTGKSVNAFQPFQAILQQASHSKQLTIALHLKPNIPAILDEVRIDIKELIELLCRKALGRQASICITLWHPLGAGTKSSSSVAFHELLKRVFLVLSDMMIQWPKDLPQAIGRQLPCININGHGTVLYATYSAGSDIEPFRVQNRHARLRSQEVEVAGYRMTTAVAKAYRKRTSRTTRESPQSLYATWKGLRQIYWPEFKKRRPEQAW